MVRQRGLNRFCLDNSDIVSFHCYADANHTRNTCRELKKEGRPVICTEWMNRPAASTIPTVLPVFAEEEVGCMMWGLVNGKTQTDLPWATVPNTASTKDRGSTTFTTATSLPTIRPK
ncbi:MAG: hypothetical protein ACLRSE_00945 [Alistipes finegoldii]